jgi:hypothetical protein
MRYRPVLCVTAVAFACLLTSCTKSASLSSIQITPATASVGTVGGTAQFTAIGTYSKGGAHPPTTQNITDEATWASSSTGVATVDSTGLATAVSVGTTTITAIMNGSSGPVVGTATLTVTTGVQTQRELTAITVIPSSQTLNTIGGTAQFIAIGTYNVPPTTENLAGNPNFQGWVSSEPSVATIDSSGLATAVACGTSTCVTTITATYTDPLSGTIVGTASLTVSPGSPPQQRALSAITILPGSGTRTLYTLGETSQFIAIGTYTAVPTTVDITDTVTWASSVVGIATINSSGLATAVACGSPAPPCISNITASITDPVSGFIVGTSNISVDPNGGGSNLPSLSVYLVGAGTGTVTSSPAGINCTGSGTGCTAYFPQNSTVTLTATPSSGSFGGWSANCTLDTANPCTVTMNTNQTVGAIFN